jgi:hypothetical protein
MDLDESLCKFCAILDYPKIITFCLFAVGNTQMADEKICAVEPTLAPLATGPYTDLW